MPLPPALAARLAKRGLLKDAAEKPAEPPSADEAEEIIAEDYDDDHASNDKQNDEAAEALVFETVACPNKTNRYHECVTFCKEHWGLKAFVHNPALDKKHERLLRRYPLAENIVEVGDPETGRYYYWNVESDEVSWLPPQHPLAKVSLPAEKLREQMKSAGIPLPDTRPPERDLKDRDRKGRKRGKDSAGESDEESSGAEDDDDISEEKDFETLEKEILRRKRQSETDRGAAKKKKDVNLDPMDPAAYSDIPKGKWSAGLEGKGSADSTAAGPLFQQRPYPNPGAVLKMNKE